MCVVATMEGVAGVSDLRITSPPSFLPLPPHSPIRRPPFAHPSPLLLALLSSPLRLPSLHAGNLVLTHFSLFVLHPNLSFALLSTPPPKKKINQSGLLRLLNDSCLCVLFSWSVCMGVLNICKVWKCVLMHVCVCVCDLI